ncbi:MAG: xanthine dehydrogenase family protein molybdopterin-binding subunit [Nitrospinota bacterium]|nr:xanthine dehydrogenase family protein molybdopterin-binding subunit [Nitrospinota bacterium]
MSDYKVAGKGFSRIDASDKVLGTARFAADNISTRTLIGMIVGSKHAYAKVISVDVSKAIKIPGVRVVLTREDCPDNRFGGSIKDRSWFAKDGYVRFEGDPVAAIAAESREAAIAASEAIEIKYKVLEPVVSALSARKGEGPIIHKNWKNLNLGPESDGRVIARFEKGIGELEEALEMSDFVFEHTFQTSYVHAAYLEPHACLVEPSGDGKVTILTSTQSPFDIRNGVCDALGLPHTKVRVIPTEIGGGFGAKIRSTVEHIVALLALKTNRPIHYEMSREDDHRIVNPRHPHVINIKTGVTKDGKIIARDIDVTMDHGAYADAAPMQCSSKMALATSTYHIPNFRIKACTTYTNGPVSGPVRAPSGPQYHYAMEVHTDIIAREMGIDPVEFRRKNALQPGDKIVPSGGPYADGEYKEGSIRDVLEKVVEEGDWGDPIDLDPSLSAEGWVPGRGIAFGYWPGPGGAASCSIRLNDDGSFHVVGGSVNLTGSSTSLCQLAAEELGVGLDKVRFDTGDTDTAPESIRAAGSMVTRSLGAAVLKAAKDARSKILKVASSKLEANPEDLVIEDGHVFVKSSPDRSISLSAVAKSAPQLHGFILGEGESEAPPPCPIYTAQIAEVAVNPEIGEIKVLRLLCAQDVGFAINPLSVAGQIEGAMIQGMGMALLEKLSQNLDGKLSGESLHDYLLPTSLDLPKLEVFLLENPAEGTPYGARGVGEPPICATAAAIGNAIQDAVGATIFSIPVSPDDIKEAMGSLEKVS